MNKFMDLTRLPLEHDIDVEEYIDPLSSTRAAVGMTASDLTAAMHYIKQKYSTGLGVPPTVMPTTGYYTHSGTPNSYSRGIEYGPISYDSSKEEYLERIHHQREKANRILEERRKAGLSNLQRKRDEQYKKKDKTRRR